MQHTTIGHTSTEQAATFGSEKWSQHWSAFNLHSLFLSAVRLGATPDGLCEKMTLLDLLPQ